MSLHCLRIPALLILALPLCAQTQSLGDAARQVRSERQQSGTSEPKVYTNDDLAGPSSSAESAAESNDRSGTAGEPAAAPESSAEGAGKTAESKSAAPAKRKPTPEQERAARELQLDKRTQEINQHYLDKIAEVRAQIDAAQQDIARLQRDQVESTNLFQRSSGTNPSVLEYQEQQRLFNEQIQTQRDLLVSLSSQLDDAQESARHAGVPHATD
jgi:uncharacterized protein YukE